MLKIFRFEERKGFGFPWRTTKGVLFEIVGTRHSGHSFGTFRGVRRGLRRVRSLCVGYDRSPATDDDARFGSAWRRWPVPSMVDSAHVVTTMARWRQQRLWRRAQRNRA